jgi:hypothetical protein
MNHMALTVVVAATFALSDAQAGDLPKHDRFDYPSLEEIYKECKRSIEIAETDTSTFLRTACARQMNGVFNGFFQVLARFQPVSDPNDPCNHIKTTIHSDVQSLICFPSEVRKGFPEVGMARDFVGYIDDQLKRNGEFLSTHSKENAVFVVGQIVMTMYRCPIKSQEGGD